MSDERAHVLDMLNAARAIQRFIAGRTQESFLEDEQLQSAVLHKFTVLGEACRRVSAGFRAEAAAVDWAGIGGFRNKIVHDYDEIDLDVIWTITQGDLPKAIAALEPLVPKEPDGANG
jgi:uncharacterized protein with HEPN domain